MRYEEYVLILGGIFMGTLARAVTLRVDSRQNPSFPTGYFINLVTGFIASTLGAVAIPAFMNRDFTAVTFLTLAVQHFREIRKLESESFGKLERTEYTERGAAYIDGIAKTYEARNYISLLTSFFTVLAMRLCYTGILFADCLIGLAAGLIVLFFLQALTKGRTVADICDIAPGAITVAGSKLYVDGMPVTALLGTDESRERLQNEGVAAVLTPKTDLDRVTLENAGQRQAVLFEAIRSLGVKQYQFAQSDPDSGKTLIAFVPIVRNPGAMLYAIGKTPILENSRKLRAGAANRRD